MKIMEFLIWGIYGFRMATLIPDPLPVRTPSSERELARVLRRLPDHWIVYYGPKVGHHRPAFLLLAPEHGALAIEVRDWKSSSLQSLDHEFAFLQSARMVHAKKLKNPLLQVQDYWRAVKDLCQSTRFGQALVARDEKWRGHLCFPLATAVIFTRINCFEIETPELRASWKTMFVPENSVEADERWNWESLAEAELVTIFERFFRPSEKRKRFTPHQVDVLRWVLFPGSRMDSILGRESADRERALMVLDPRQESHARSLGTGHRMVFGVAGSGKTVLLLARARWTAKRQPGARILLLCYNKVLAAWLSARIADCPQVTVRHFDAWAKDQGVPRKWKERDEAFGNRFLGALGGRGDAARNWDVMLIDEAQDFEPSWFKCALTGMKDPKHGDLVIVADGSQRLYRRAGLSWKNLGIKAAGSPMTACYDLDRDYRNPPRIAALAQSYGMDEQAEDGVPSRPVDPSRCLRANRSVPTYVDAADSASQVDAALEIVRRWLRGVRGGKLVPPLNPEDIGILYPKLVDRPQLDRLIAGLSELAPTRWLSNPTDPAAHTAVDHSAIKVQTVHSAKGLQYKAAIVLWADALPLGADDEEFGKRLLYVAITRAGDDLVLLGSRSRVFAQELQSTCAVRRFPFGTTEPPAVA